MTAAWPRIDSHHHFWRRQRGDYAWLREDDPALAPLLRDFEPDDLSPILRAHRIDQTVLVQAAATADETDYLLDVAERHPFIGAVVGWVDLAAADASDHLKLRKQHRKFKGIRPMLQDLADPEWIARAPQSAALTHVQRLGLCLDALVGPQHLNALTRTLRSLPELQVVIDHAGKPPLGANADLAAFEVWRQGMRALAQRPGTMCKFSGLLTQFGSAPPSDVADRVAGLRPVWEALLEWFGPERLMWGSDWPVLLLAGTYRQWLEIGEALIGELSAAEQAQIWAGNAARFYSLNDITEQG